MRLFLILILFAAGAGGLYLWRESAATGEDPMVLAQRLAGLESTGADTARVAAATPAAPAGETAALTSPDAIDEGELRRIVIGLDLSKSNPLVTDRAYARKVADRVAGEVRALAFRSEVRLRTFGTYGAGFNPFRFDATVSARYRADVMAEEVRTLIASVPDLIERGVWKAQQKTNIIAFLDNAAAAFGCADMETRIILATDGIEDSEFARLIDRRASLPEPGTAHFAGCERLEILGLGQGRDSPTLTLRLREEWSRWAEASGFENFTGLNDW